MAAGVGFLIRCVPAASESSGFFQISGPAVSLPPAGLGPNSIFPPSGTFLGDNPRVDVFQTFEMSSVEAGSPVSPQYDACWPAIKLSGSAGESRSLIGLEHGPGELDTYVDDSVG